MGLLNFAVLLLYAILAATSCSSSGSELLEALKCTNECSFRSSATHGDQPQRLLSYHSNLKRHPHSRDRDPSIKVPYLQDCMLPALNASAGENDAAFRLGYLFMVSAGLPWAALWNRHFSSAPLGTYRAIVHASEHFDNVGVSFSYQLIQRQRSAHGDLKAPMIALARAAIATEVSGAIWVSGHCIPLRPYQTVRSTFTSQPGTSVMRFINVAHKKASLWSYWSRSLLAAADYEAGANSTLKFRGVW